jgi:hypothetical protein
MHFHSSRSRRLLFYLVFVYTYYFLSDVKVAVATPTSLSFALNVTATLYSDASCTSFLEEYPLTSSGLCMNTNNLAFQLLCSATEPDVLKVYRSTLFCTVSPDGVYGVYVGSFNIRESECVNPGNISNVFMKYDCQRPFIPTTPPPLAPDTSDVMTTVDIVLYTVTGVSCLCAVSCLYSCVLKMYQTERRARNDKISQALSMTEEEEEER